MATSDKKNKKKSVFEDVEIHVSQLNDNDGNMKGRLVILRGGLKSTEPISFMNNIVSNYVLKVGEPYNEFVEIQMDNPWVRVLVFGINEIGYTELSSIFK